MHNQDRFMILDRLCEEWGRLNEWILDPATSPRQRLSLREIQGVVRAEIRTLTGK